MPTVLIVDDELSIRQTLGKLLRCHGYQTLLAADAYCAMGMAQKNCPDLILLDVQIPPMDGLTFLMLLRQEPRVHEIPVILLTGLSDDNTVNRAKDLGVKAHLVKGMYRPDELLATIIRVLQVDVLQSDPPPSA